VLAGLTGGGAEKCGFSARLTTSAHCLAKLKTLFTPTVFIQMSVLLRNV
jgi:hypothetical protein